MSILRILLAFAAMAAAGGGGAVPPGPMLTIHLREGDRPLLNARLPLVWDVRSEAAGVNATDVAVAAVVTQVRTGTGPAAKLWMQIRRGEGAGQMTVLVPRVLIGCSGSNMVTIARAADDPREPLHLTLTIDPAAIDPACVKP